MKFTLSWLKDHLETEAPLDLIATTLTRIGLEVEDIADPAAALGAFVVGEVLTAERHPNADRLQICTVATGAGAPVEVVCGAPNARAGLKTAFAKIGTVIPASGEALKAGQIRGVVSNGMLCSARELKLGEDHDGILELPAEAIPGTPIAGWLGLDDPVIEINLTPNRADCAGVRGIARDLAAAGLGRLKPLAVAPVPGRFPSPVGVEITDRHACPAFLGRVISGVRNGPSPAWLQRRLTAIGLRPISALVDITNYFTFDRCRPLHVFDLAKVQGNLLTVRPASEGEQLEALNGKSYTLPAGVTVIADAAGVESLGGIMGGAATGCAPETTDVVLECALFDPKRTAETGRALAINSDARYRFERGLDPAALFDGMEAATWMILELCGGEASEVVVAGSVPDWRRSVGLRPTRVASLGGVDVPQPRQVEILKSLGCTVSYDYLGPVGDEKIPNLLQARTADRLQVTIPSWRGDIEGEADLVEEVLRIEGFERIPSTPLPRVAVITRSAVDAEQRRAIQARRILAARGLEEAVTWSFLGQADSALFGGASELDLLNPISADLATMRPSILPNLIRAAARNAARGYPDAALFEIGPAFRADPEIRQSTYATGVRTGFLAGRHWQAKPAPVGPLDAKADAVALLGALGLDTTKLTITRDVLAWFHPGQSGSLMLGPKRLGVFGTLHPDVVERLELDAPCAGFEIELDAVPLPRRKGTERPPLALSPFQPVKRDFAFLVDADLPADRLIRAIRSAERNLVTDARLFDLYAGPGVPDGKKSLAVEITIQPGERTLTDAEIEAVAKKVTDAAAKEAGASLRQ